MLDYRYGWRWLLPLGAQRSVSLIGFSAEEDQFWRSVLHVTDHGSGNARIDLLIVDGHSCSPDPALIANAAAVCVLSDRHRTSQWRSLLVSNFPYIREYALLPSEEPRLVIPLSSAIHAFRSLALHRPGRLWARVALTLARWLARAGCFYLLRKSVLMIATDSQSSTPIGAIQAGLNEFSEWDIDDYALYLGSPDDNRKTVVLPLGAKSPTAIVKIGTSPVARFAVERESAALAFMSDKLTSLSVPRPIKTTISREAVTLFQEYRPRRWAPPHRFKNEVVKFLGRLATLGIEKQPLADVLSHLIGKPDDILLERSHEQRVLQEKMREIANRGGLLWFHRVHGDFAPWNCAWTDKGLFVYDWEASEAAGIAMSDAFYFVCAPAIEVCGRSDPEKTLTSALHFARRVAATAKLDLNIETQFAAWLLSRPESLFTNRLMQVLSDRWR